MVKLHLKGLLISSVIPKTCKMEAILAKVYRNIKRKISEDVTFEGQRMKVNTAKYPNIGIDITQSLHLNL